MLRGFLLSAMIAAAPTCAAAQPPERIAEAARAWSEGRLDKANAAIAALATEHGLPSAVAAVAERLLRDDRTDDALSLVTGVAEALLRQGDASTVATMLTRIVPAAPDEAALHALLGRALARSEQHGSAVEHLTRALELGAADLETCYYLASAQWENEAYVDAERNLRRGLAASSGAFPWRHQLGRLLLWLGRAEEATVELDAAARQRPTAADVQLDLARALEGAGRLDDAATAYRRATTLAPNASKAHWGLAQTLLRQGDRDAARAPLGTYQRLYREEQARTLRDSRDRALLDRGWDQLRRGDAGAARTHFTGLEDSVEALRGVAAAAAALGDHAGAVEALERAVVLTPDDQGLRRELAEARLAVDGG